jgi:hypothetical protein
MGQNYIIHYIVIATLLHWGQWSSLLPVFVFGVLDYDNRAPNSSGLLKLREDDPTRLGHHQANT